jgi:hypothetical protein
VRDSSQRDDSIDVGSIEHFVATNTPEAAPTGEPTIAMPIRPPHQ